ncbi:hypothetical protein LCGC14_1014710 [marine sediment metagenome]|uniref:Uncharacterized protein n=1 Tax=marine sediment metagenome TaxID=412755 RepID=A0A0F9R585_9ZZZZ
MDIKKELNIVCITLLVILMMIFSSFYLIEPKNDFNKVAKMVCEDKGLKLLDKTTIIRDVSNDTRYSITRVFYKVECSDNKIYSYEYYRYVNWEQKDCSIIDKWGECKLNIISKRIKSVGYYE